MAGTDQARGAADHWLETAVAGFEALGPWPHGLRAAIAFSGGADSLFLALAWLRFAAGKPLSGLALVVDHGHRAGTAEEAAAALELCRGLALPGRVLPLAPGARSEAALREARYRALAAAAHEEGAAVLLTGHQADDVAETLLLRLARGTGLRGLAGIPARREVRLPDGGALEIRRPLLSLRRGAIRAALRELGQPWIEDPTNADIGSAARNRMRSQVLPALSLAGPADPVSGLLRLAAEAREWQEALAALLRAAPAWRPLPSYLRRQAVAAQLRAAGETVSPARLRDLEEALLRRGSAGVTAGFRLSLRAGRLRLCRSAGPEEEADPAAP